jgi:SNF2 family DNA or RNA helicase
MQLYQHQIDGLNIGRRGSHAFFWQCGVGKTCLMVHLIRHWKAQGVGPAMVVCPLSIIESAWIEDIKKFVPGQLSAVSLWSKNPAQRKERLAQDHDVYIANFETFKSLYPEIIKKRFGILIVDESSKMKQHDSQITRALLSLAGMSCKAKDGTRYQSNWIVPFRYTLSGTPAPNCPTEYWPQIKLITGPGNDVFPDNYYAFRGYYCYPIPISPVCKKWQFKTSMQKEFMEKMADVAHVVKKEDAVDLPSQIHVIRKVYLSEPEQKAYDTLKNDLVLRYGGHEILANSAIVEVIKLRQLTSGFAYTDTGAIQTGTSKLAELKGLLEEIGHEQVIIWANFKYEISLLLKELPNSAALWSETADRDQAINDFKAGKFQYLIAHPASAAHGLTFTNCCYNVYFSVNYSYELYEQSLSRVHRIGQKHSVTYFHILAERTIDLIIYRAVLNKQVMSNSVLNYLKSSQEQITNVKSGSVHSKRDSSVSPQPAAVCAV